MKIADFCIRRRVTTVMIFVVLTIFGVVGFSRLALALIPNVELPMAVVYTTFPGAGPEEVEQLVTRKLESACASVAGMKELTSESSENMSLIMVSFEDGTDMDTAALNMREQIDFIKSSLPEDCAAPMVMALDPSLLPVSMITLQGKPLNELQTLADDSISPALERLDGVAQVTVYGGYEMEIAVDTYASSLAGYNLSVSYLAQILAANNIMVPAGTVDNGQHSLSVRTNGEFASVEDVANTLIPLPTGGTVRLGEIADVHLAPQDQIYVTKLDGDSCVLLTVSQQSDVNTANVAKSVSAEMKELAEKNPSLQYNIVMDQSDFIDLSVNNTIRNIIFGVLLAALVLFLFLRDFGATAVIAISMPVCIVQVFLIMQVFDITLNTLSLGGIAMGVGMIVDNSIVVLENIFRFRADGKKRLESCVEGSAEVALPVIASTLTTVVVFLPIGLSNGLSGQLFRDFALTIAALLLSSLLISLTLVPLLCFILLDRGRSKAVRRMMADRPQTSFRLMERYRGALSYLLHKRKVGVIASVVLLVLFIAPIAGAGVELIPSMDQGSISIDVTLPIGSELEETAVLSDRIVTIAQENVPEIDYIYYEALPESSAISVYLVPLKERDRSSEEVGNQMRELFQDIAGCEITVNAGDFMAMMTGDDINVKLSGNDYEELKRISEDLTARIAALPDALNVKSSVKDETPQVNITLNRENAARFGLTAATIGQAVRSELTGTSATKLRVSGTEISVTVRGDKASSTSIDNLRTLSIPTATGGAVPLSLVANVDVELAPQTINRSNQARVVTITGSSLSGDTNAISKAIQGVIDEYGMPEGYFAEMGGAYENMQESFTTLAYALLISVGLVYFVLASQFESFLMPVIIMLIVPLSFAGGLFGLPITGNKFSIVSIIGIIILAGVVVNSSIILVDYTNTRRRRGEDKNTALLNACPRRVRPVLMTMTTTVLGLMPMALSRGEGSELMTPMAVVMIFGMIISTVVTLFFTPVYYSLLDSLSERFRNKKKKKKKPDSRRSKDPEKETDTETAPLPALAAVTQPASLPGPDEEHAAAQEKAKDKDKKKQKETGKDKDKEKAQGKEKKPPKPAKKSTKKAPE